MQRLGEQLSIATQVNESDTGIILDIDWNDYFQDQNLLSISNELNELDENKGRGTKLTISGLRDKWTTAAIKRVYKYVTDIIQPFPLSELNTDDEVVTDPGFKAIFNKIENGEKKLIANESIMILENSLAVFEGYIDSSGIGIYTIESEKIGIDEIGEIGNDPDDKTIPFSLLKNIRFRAYYFIYGINEIPKGQETSIRSLARKEGGIRLYRNGFRVLPYAEQGDDWLKLNESAGKRTLLAPHSNNNFFGFVEMKDKDNLFNETSSREGLITNDALVQLQNFIYRTIMTGVVKVASVRKSKMLTNQKKNDAGDWDWEDLEVRIQNIALTLDELDRELDESTTGIETKTRRRKKIKKIKKDIEQVQEKQDNEIKKLIKERSMLRVLSSVGLTVSQFVHEIKYYLDNILNDIRFVALAVEKDEIVSERMSILANNFEIFKDYTSYFNDVVSQNVIREIEPLNLKFIVQKFVTSMSPDAKKSGVVFAESQFNFYTNSRKAIKRAKSEGLIFIECGESDDMIYLEFSDNGDGIEKENEEVVFDEFFTTTSPINFENIDTNNEVLGTGLGLKIVKDIIKSYRGEVLVVSPKGEFSTCIRVEIPKATQKDLDAYGL